MINLISGPRNISTALMYSFASREDFDVLDEPFYAYYLANADLQIEHPSQDEIVRTMETDEFRIVRNINEKARERNLFIKGMAHHYLNDAPDYILNWSNVILIRHPARLIASFSKVISNPTINDIGLKKAVYLLEYLKSNGQQAVVIDSDELMVDPEEYLKELCARLDISFSSRMLKWKQGGIPQDGIWAPHWYANVHKTTGFRRQQKTEAEVPVQLKPLLEEALPFYDQLQQFTIKNH